MLIQPQKNVRQSNNSNEEGFTLIEVLVGIIMATVFTLVTTQAIAISALYRVKAQRQSEALQWIQQDFEELKFDALTALPGGDCTNGYALALASYFSGDTIAAFPETHIGSVDSFIDAPVLLNKTFEVTRTFNAYETTAPFNVLTVSYSITDPTNPNTATNEIATFYSEVLPDAAFSCN
ncbi:hypothetical protein Lepto7376_2866 [[Leptolyngbya] sp. PCC 7376]|uniref:type IV pilus modification PilV family protein n=1 Tax=[Leptolyngbya] sp. PCC 7376 TaxID=111781 RepID=UPI00029EE5EE|nr:type II secretion system protein [[Leptolyngbya] sp. PCC 7376]AFY39118.1 hypothetical protein Lepto7376_2866 [[Leptolyngbya] sp. PCC 7376]